MRLHKTLGYGLDDLKTSQGKIIDPRLSDEFIHFLTEGRYFDHYDNQDYLKHIQASDPERFSEDYYLLTEGETRHSVEECVIWGGQLEDSQPQVLIFHPLSFRERWFRFDDEIDYQELSVLPNTKLEYANVIAECPENIGIFKNRFMYKRTQEMLPNNISMLLEALDYANKQEADKLAAEFGFTDAADCRNNCIPYITPDIKYLTSFLNAFKEQNEYLNLKPLYFRYWA